MQAGRPEEAAAARGAGRRVRRLAGLRAAAALGSVPALGEHPGGAGGGASVRVPALRCAGGQSGPAPEARRSSDQQTSTER